MYPNVLPEDRWKQKIFGELHRKQKPRFIDHLPEWSDYPDQ